MLTRLAKCVFEPEVRLATLHLLGTGAAFSDASRTTTMLAVSTDRSVIVIDCGGDVVQRLLAQGIDLDAIEAVVVTHEHADHVAGFPLMMERLWLGGRSRPLDVYGIESAIAQVRRIHDAFDVSKWPGYPELCYHVVEHVPDAVVLECEAWRVVCSPGSHPVPVIALRIEDRVGGGVLTYSCDTERSASVERLASGSDILVHEATGAGPGHSSATEAAEVATKAGAARLVLVHIAPFADEGGKLAAEAGRGFPGAVVGVDGQTFAF